MGRTSVYWERPCLQAYDVHVHKMIGGTSTVLGLIIRVDFAWIKLIAVLGAVGLQE